MLTARVVNYLNLNNGPGFGNFYPKTRRNGKSLFLFITVKVFCHNGNEAFVQIVTRVSLME